MKTKTAVSVRFGKDSADLLRLIRVKAKRSRRSLSNEIKYLARLGAAALDNPDLPAKFVAGVLEGLDDAQAGRSVPLHAIDRWASPMTAREHDPQGVSGPRSELRQRLYGRRPA